MHGRDGFRLAAALLALAFVMGACSGGSGQESAADVAGSAGERRASDLADEDGPDQGDDTSEASAERRSGGEAARSSGTVTSPSGVEVTTPAAGGPPVANLFTADENRIGLHEDRIVLCGHAATSFGPAFNTSEADLNVYWEEVGEIHGRRVEVSYENDNYDPTTARQAAQACKQKNPFILLGGIGFDQIPAVRKFAEDNRMFYVHHIAREDLTKKFSFSPLPTVEQAGDFAGQWAGTQYKGRKIGVIYRQSENWEPGRTTFVRRVQRLGGTIVAQVGVEQNQGRYLDVMAELKNRGAEVVFVWENALAATQIIQQAKGQNWHPQFLIFPFNVTTDALGPAALNPPIHGISTWAAYSPGDYGGPFASYEDEIRRMEEVYARRRPGTQVTDIHWMVWLAYRDLHRFLVDCGADCTRNKLLGLMLARKYTDEELNPSCAVDYTRNGHVGGFSATMFTAYGKGSGRAGWRHIPEFTCRESFLN